MLFKAPSVAVTHKYQLPLFDWVKAEPLVKTVEGVQLEPLFQQYFVDEMPELPVVVSLAETITETSELAQDLEFKLKAMTGPVLSDL